MLLPLLGYLLGAVIAWALGQPPADILAIAVETGIQNTGIAIFMLQFCLKQPAADLTTGNAEGFLITFIKNLIKPYSFIQIIINYTSKYMQTFLRIFYYFYMHFRYLGYK